MPVRSLSSSVLKWPDAKAVDHAIRIWAEKIARKRKDILRIGYFGSYARGDWGVGSDLDVIILLESSEEPFERRGAKWDLTELPVPADWLIYTEREWASLNREGRFYKTVMQETVWVYVRDDQVPDSGYSPIPGVSRACHP
jgi:predicted nucleotidyltransferase